MLKHRLTLLLILLAPFGYVSAQAQGEPGFDCTKARTAVEHALCNTGNPRMGWIDRTMNDLYGASLKAQPGNGSALRANQREWLAHRDSCKGSENKIMNCLWESYGARFNEIATPYDTSHLTGRYSQHQRTALIEVVLFPDRTLATYAEASLGAPSYNSCNLSFRAPLNGDAVDYTLPREDWMGPKDPLCRIQLTKTRSGFLVKTEYCESQCGNGVSLDGAYTR